MVKSLIVIVQIWRSAWETQLQLCELYLDAVRFRHLGQFFMKPSDYYDALIYKVQHFSRGMGLMKGQLKGEAQ
jgi:hypothetical protein